MSGLLVVVPFAAALVGIGVGRHRPRLAAPVAITGTALATVVAVVLAARVLGSGDTSGLSLGTVATGGPPVTLALRVDGRAALVALAVCAVALAVQVYSTEYLRGDPRYASYSAFVSLFTAAMLLVVVAADLLVLYVGWEVMGVCSYFLVGHHWEQESARSGAVKAFLTTRVGDVGLLFGVFVLGTAAGSFRIEAVLTAVPTLPKATVTTAALLVLLGVAGKSAQFPLHTWLPDAMAGPTPVSALIHAATMVAAGIYVVLVLYGVFLAAPAALAVLGVVAAVSMLGAALAALAQDDIKRILAYSTISQLAYMAGALAVGGPDAAAFHLLTHAAFKALLFLAAGAVIHAVGTNLMADMGGLRARMPVTFVAMTLGLAALAGVPPLAGFVSKESVLAAAEETARHGGVTPAWVGWLVLVAGLLTVAVTAAYATRLELRTFFSESRSSLAAHEAPPLLRWPVLALVVPTVLLGAVGLRADWLPAWLGAGDRSLAPQPVTAALSLVALLLGTGGTYAAWRRDPAADPARLLGRARPALEHAFYVDELYAAAVVRPVRALAGVVRATDRDVVDAYVRGSGIGARLLGGALRRTQTGNVQGYLTGVLAGTVLLAVGALVVLRGVVLQ